MVQSKTNAQLNQVETILLHLGVARSAKNIFHPMITWISSVSSRCDFRYASVVRPPCDLEDEKDFQVDDDLKDVQVKAASVPAESEILWSGVWWNDPPNSVNSLLLDLTIGKN
jgi:hypothetical protein